MTGGVAYGIGGQSASRGKGACHPLAQTVCFVSRARAHLSRIAIADDMLKRSQAAIRYTISGVEKRENESFQLTEFEGAQTGHDFKVYSR